MQELLVDGRNLAAELANAEEGTIKYEAHEFADVRWQAGRALARLATEHLALKAEHEKALADLREIGKIVGPDGPQISVAYATIRAIAAKYRVETDPLVAEAREMFITLHNPNENCHREIRAGEWDDRLAIVALLAALKRGYEIGEKS